MEVKIGSFRNRMKLACFDYDHTLVKPKNNRVFPINKDDWTWLRPNVPSILKNYYKRGYSIVIITNQSKQFKVEQISYVLSTLKIPCLALIGLTKEQQKPNPYMFGLVRKPKTDMEKSFYVGDALGRYGDWSDSDKMFAINCGLKYYSPEEIFPFKPMELKKSSKGFKKIKKQNAIMMIGYPGSGKTTFTEKLKDYDVLHGDDFKIESKLKKELKNKLDLGKSVVLDATNYNKKKRKVFLDIIKSYKIPIKAVHMNTSFEESFYRNSLRDKKVPKIAFYVYRKRFEPPSLDEGFDEIVLV